MMNVEQVERYRNYLYKFFLSKVDNIEDAEELTNTACFKACRGNYTPTEKFITWLSAVATNVLRDFYRRRTAQKIIPRNKLDDIDELYALPNMERWVNPTAHLDSQENMNIIRKVINTLPSRQSEIITMRYIDDMRIDDIATELGISVGATKASLFNGKRTLKSRLAEVINA